MCRNGWRAANSETDFMPRSSLSNESNATLGDRIWPAGAADGERPTTPGSGPAPRSAGPPPPPREDLPPEQAPMCASCQKSRWPVSRSKNRKWHRSNCYTHDGGPPVCHKCQVVTWDAMCELHCPHVQADTALVALHQGTMVALAG